MRREWILAPLVLLLTACATTLTCPPVDGPTRAVFVLDHGRHTSLVIENDRGFLHRYAYGERRWYAEMDVGFWRALGAGFTNTDAVRGRRELRTQPNERGLLRALRVGVESLHGFRVEAERADALIHELDGIFLEGMDAVVYNDRYGLEFAPHPRPYTVWYNSNHMIADWMEDLGCTATGSAMRANWRPGNPRSS